LKSILKLFAAAKGASPEDHEAFIYRSLGPISTVLIVVIEVDSTLLREIITIIKRRFEKANKIVFVTDNDDFAIFREHNVFFEYLPPIAAQHRYTDMPWQSYLRERWNLLLAKWRPKVILSYGRNIDAFLNAAPSAPVPGLRS